MATIKHDRPYFKGDIRMCVIVNGETTIYKLSIFTTINNEVKTESTIVINKIQFFELVDELKLSHTPTTTIGSIQYTYFTFNK